MYNLNGKKNVNLNKIRFLQQSFFFLLNDVIIYNAHVYNVHLLCLVLFEHVQCTLMKIDSSQ